MATVTTWLKDLLARTPGAQRKVVKREFMLAVREFFEHSCAWRAVIGPTDMLSGSAPYVLSPYDAETDVIAVLAVEVEGIGLPPAARRPGLVDQPANRPRLYYLTDVDTVNLWPSVITLVDDALTFHVALTPRITKADVVLPDIAESKFYDALLDGALGRLYNHPAKPYSDPIKAEYHLKRFRAAIGAYAGEGKRGFAGALSWQFPRFGK